MKILAYRGKSLISRLIRWQTRSPYSHIAVQLDDGSVVEAWHKGGVRHIGDPLDGHTPGTDIDVYGVYSMGCELPSVAKNIIEQFLLAQVGKKYDFVSVARFVTRRLSPADEKWFCSELAEAAFIVGGFRLLNGPASHHSPRDTVMSPYLVYETTIRG